MSNYQTLLQIRNKKLGLLIQDARKSLRRTVEECAQAAGVTPEQFQEFEKGQQAPSLPQLEMLSMFFNLPLEHFSGKQSLGQPVFPGQDALPEKERLILLRNRVIGTNLRMARTNAKLEIRDLAEKTGISEEALRRYEMGEAAVPVSELEVLARSMDVSIEGFYDQHGPIGKWRSQQTTMQRFLELPPEIQQFVAKPVNRPYLELAMRLSELSTEKLRAVAEVLLEITY